MKKFIVLILFAISAINSFAQVPEGINYQAVARNNFGNPLINSSAFTVQFTIHNGSSSGPAIYVERHSNVKTNEYGLFALVIGNGTMVGTNLFSSINWSMGSKFLEVEINDTGSGFYQIGNTEMISVPYALYAKSAGGSLPNGSKGQTLYHNNVKWDTTSNLLIDTTVNSKIGFKVYGSNEYLYAIPKEHFYSVSGASFFPLKDITQRQVAIFSGATGNLKGAAAYLNTTTTTNVDFIAPVNLPDASTIIGITAYLIDSSFSVGPNNVELMAYPINTSSTLQIATSDQTTNSPGQQILNLNYLNIGNNVINNVAYTYCLIYTGPKNLQKKILHVMIQYKVSKAD